MPESGIFQSRILTDQDAGAAGYERVELGIDAPELEFSVLAKDGSLVTRLGQPSAIEAPGRSDLAKIFVPESRDAFEVTVSAFKPDFAAEAPTAAEQVLLENGYAPTELGSPSLVDGDMFGATSGDAGIAKAARSACQTRGEYVLCFLMEFDEEHRDTASEQASVLLGSLRYADGQPATFAPEQLATLALPLADAGSFSFRYPSAWSLAENDFQGSLPSSLQIHHGEAENPASVLVLTASAGAPPPNADAIDGVAETMIANYVEDNAHIIANPSLELRSDVAGLEPKIVPSRAYVFLADKVGGEGQVQLRLSLIAHGGLRYGVLMVTSFTEGLDETGPFFARWSGTTAYDIALEDVVQHVIGTQ